MGRKLTGYTRNRNGAIEVWVGGDYIASVTDPDQAERIKSAAVQERTGAAPSIFSVYSRAWWVDREELANKLGRVRAFEKEKSVWDFHVTSAKFFHAPLKSFKPKMIQAWIGTMAKKHAMHAITVKDSNGKPKTVLRDTGRPLSRRVLEQALKYVKQVLDQAIIDGKMSGNVNPARLVKLPREGVPLRDGQLIVHLLVEEIDHLLAMDLPPLQRAVFTTAIYAGLRDDELWGLRWMDVTLDGARPEIRVRRSYAGPCKTVHSIRDVPLFDEPIAALKAWRTSQQAASAPVIGEALVFPAESGGCHHESYTAGWRDKYRKVNGKIVRSPGWRSRAGIREEVDFKDMRHTCGCHLVQGTWTDDPMPMEAVKQWLGHSSLATTEKHYATFTAANLHSRLRGKRDPKTRADKTGIKRESDLAIRRKSSE